MKIAKLILIFILFAGSALAEHEEEKSVPYGMESQKIGDVNVVLPRGSGMTKKNGRILVESDSQYAARKFLQIETRLDKMEAGQEGIERGIESLKDSVAEIERDILNMYETGGYGDIEELTSADLPEQE